MIDCQKCHVLYLDPIKTGLFSKDKVASDLAVIKKIVWFCVMERPLDTDVPSTLPGWTIIDHDLFSLHYKQKLPDQEYGVDCGAFTIMYFWYIAMGAQFDFSTCDMDTIRCWCYHILEVCMLTMDIYHGFY